MNFRTWTAAEADRHNVIAVRPVYIDMAEDLVAGILLGQIVYWYTPDKAGKSRLRVVKRDKADGQHYQWIAKQHAEWWDEIRITERQIPRALKILEKKNLIVTQVNLFNGLRATHIRLNIPEFERELDKHLNKITELHDMYAPNYASRSFETTLCVAPLTETTSENNNQGADMKSAHLLNEFPNDVKPFIREFVDKFSIPIPEKRADRGHWINSARMFMGEIPDIPPAELIGRLHEVAKTYKIKGEPIAVKSPDSLAFLLFAGKLEPADFGIPLTQTEEVFSYA